MTHSEATCQVVQPNAHRVSGTDKVELLGLGGVATGEARHLHVGHPVLLLLPGQGADGDHDAGHDTDHQGHQAGSAPAHAATMSLRSEEMTLIKYHGTSVNSVSIYSSLN